MRWKAALSVRGAENPLDRKPASSRLQGDILMQEQPKQQHLVLAGGYGVVGTGVVGHFLGQAKWRLTTVGRSEAPSQLWDGRVPPTHLRADLQDSDGVRESFSNLSDATALAYCA